MHSIAFGRFVSGIIVKRIFGWAPQQILLREGLLKCNYKAKAEEMVYRWLWLITKNAVEYNGTISDKFDLETSS